MALHRLGRVEEARKTFEHAVALATAEGVFSASVQALVTLDLEQNRLDDARRHLDLAWALDPRAPHSRANLHGLEFHLALRQGLGEKALVNIEAADRLMPWSGFAISRFLVLVWLGRFEAALEVSRTIDATAVRRETAELLALFEHVQRGTAGEGSLQRWVSEHETDQRGYLVMAYDELRRGHAGAVCSVLAEGRRRASKQRLLSPPWAESCAGGTASAEVAP